MSPEYDKTSIVNANKVYEGFIVGSDIVWGTNITGRDMTYFWILHLMIRKDIRFHLQ